MKTLTQNSYVTSPYWRWRNDYDLHLFHQLMPMRENHDPYKIVSKTS